MAIISLKEYAERIGLDPSTLRHKAAAGNLRTAVKIGRDWMIDEDEPYTDLRVRTGKYKDFRKKLK
jgi:predicted site-specific integrase-resolvase